MFVAVPPSLFVWWVHNIYFFVFCLFVVTLCVFATLTPINNTIMWIIPLKDRSFALALNTLLNHAFGDAFAPIVTGGLKDVFQGDRVPNTDPVEYDPTGWDPAFCITCS